ncbi:MAG: hypothetical protein GX783_01845 [Clostridiales bacterium]|nr:hypothetical protein [Clostridiales bacterium]
MSTVLKENYLNKWIWIELIGFDNQKPDFGVGDYISRCGFLPDGFVLLLYWTGFVVDHQGLDLEYELSPAEASYGAHEYSPERRRQTWTNLQLKRLIDTMHSYGCKVYLSFFNMCSYYNDVGELIEHEFYKDKNYLMETVRNAVRHGTISMLKRLPDGSFFEDFLQEKTVKALADYGFDGLQIADGISSPRIALQEGDYSDEIIDQFLEYSNIRLPDKLEALCDDNKELMNLRSDFIWQEHRLEWLKFHTFRWEQFFTKFISRLENLGKEAIFNSAWTRDPFEAIYRYGVDYRKIGKTGIKGCMVEDVSAGLAILSSHDNAYLMDDEQRKKIHYEFLTALMLNRAAMPEIKIIPLAGIHDTMEQWGGA